MKDIFWRNTKKSKPIPGAKTLFLWTETGAVEIGSVGLDQDIYSYFDERGREFQKFPQYWCPIPPAPKQIRTRKTGK